MEYLKIAKINDFKDKNIKSFSVFGKKIGLVQSGDGSFFATEIGCKHQGADLSKGEIDGYIATCNRHHWKYDLITGECINHESPKLRKHGVQVKGEDIYVSLIPIE